MYCHHVNTQHAAGAQGKQRGKLKEKRYTYLHTHSGNISPPCQYAACRRGSRLTQRPRACALVQRMHMQWLLTATTSIRSMQQGLKANTEATRLRTSGGSGDDRSRPLRQGNIANCTGWQAGLLRDLNATAAWEQEAYLCSGLKQCRRIHFELCRSPGALIQAFADTFPEEWCWMQTLGDDASEDLCARVPFQKGMYGTITCKEWMQDVRHNDMREMSAGRKAQ
eukprot:460283-Pelagomonas_calceolata.AAC.6